MMKTGWMEGGNEIEIETNQDIRTEIEKEINKPSQDDDNVSLSIYS